MIKYVSCLRENVRLFSLVVFFLKDIIGFVYFSVCRSLTWLFAGLWQTTRTLRFFLKVSRLIYWLCLGNFVYLLDISPFLSLWNNKGLLDSKHHAEGLFFLILIYGLSLRMWSRLWKLGIPSRSSCRSGPRRDTSSLRRWGWRGRSTRTRRPKLERPALLSSSSSWRDPSTSPAQVNPVCLCTMTFLCSSDDCSPSLTSPSFCWVRNTNSRVLMSSSAGVFDPYIPPEGDARLSTLSKEGLKQRTEQIRQSAASQLA